MSKTYKHIGYDDILNVSSRSGSPVDRMGNALTPANLNFKQDGDVLAARFNGDTSLIDCGDIDDLTGDISVCAWIKPYSFGENNRGKIINNGKLNIGLYNVSGGFMVGSDGNDYSCGGTVNFNIWQLVVFIRESDGNMDIYKNGTIIINDFDSKTPAAGTTNITIGNRSNQTNTFDGLIEPVIIKPRILTAAEIMQYYTQTRRFYENH